MDAIHLKTPLLGMEIKTRQGIPPSIHWIKQTIEEQHDYLITNPDEYFIYSTTGSLLIFSHRSEGLISTSICKVKADGYVTDPASSADQVYLSRAKSIEIE